MLHQAVNHFKFLQKKKIILNDIDKKRILILKENLKRLNFKTNTTNLDFEKLMKKLNIIL